jgi:hypothetical protein
MYLFLYEYVVLAYFKAAAASISFLKLLLIHNSSVFYYFTNLRNRQKSPDSKQKSSLNYINTHFIQSIYNEFFLVSNLHPGTCSPSLKVVSNIWTFSIHFHLFNVFSRLNNKVRFHYTNLKLTFIKYTVYKANENFVSH